MSTDIINNTSDIINSDVELMIRLDHGKCIVVIGDYALRSVSGIQPQDFKIFLTSGDVITLTNNGSRYFFAGKVSR